MHNSLEHSYKIFESEGGEWPAWQLWLKNRDMHNKYLPCCLNKTPLITKHLHKRCQTCYMGGEQPFTYCHIVCCVHRLVKQQHNTSHSQIFTLHWIKIGFTRSPMRILKVVFLQGGRQFICILMSSEWHIILKKFSCTQRLYFWIWLLQENIFSDDSS